MEELKIIFLGLVGSEEEVFNAKQVLEKLNFSYQIVAEQASGYEQVTLNKLHEFSKNHDGCVLYAHSKGTYTVCELNTMWRKSMNHHLITNWKTAVTFLNSHDMVGCHWIDESALGHSPFFGGNFWWAKMTHLRSLPEVRNNSRYDAERWIGLKSCKIRDLFPGFPTPDLFQKPVAECSPSIIWPTDPIAKQQIQFYENAAISIQVDKRIFLADLETHTKISPFRIDFPQLDYDVGQSEWEHIDMNTGRAELSKPLRSLYIGAIGGPVPHYGHTLLETMSRWWPLWDAEFMKNIDVLVLTWLDGYSAYKASSEHRFIPNVGDYVQLLDSWKALSTDPSIDLVTKMLVATGQTDKSLFVVGKTCKIQNLWIPAQVCQLGQYKPNCPKIGLANNLYQNFSKYWGDSRRYDKQSLERMEQILNQSTRLWLSRRCILNSRIAKNSLNSPAGMQERCCTNEPEMELLLKEKYNFISVQLDEFSIQEQIYLISQASACAGLYGTGLHNCLFAQPNIPVIVLGDLRWPSYMQPAQESVKQVANLNCTFIPLVAKSSNKQTSCYEWDLDFVVNEIGRLMSTH